VSEDNPGINDSWTGKGGTRTTSPLATQTRYTLHCTGLEGGDITDSATVTIVPSWLEI
jgi:hypothetical protein